MRRLFVQWPSWNLNVLEAPEILRDYSASTGISVRRCVRCCIPKPGPTDCVISLDMRAWLKSRRGILKSLVVRCGLRKSSGGAGAYTRYALWSRSKVMSLSTFSSCLLFSRIQDIAAVIKKEFDEMYGSKWHCIVGSSFGSFVTHEHGYFVYFHLGKVKGQRVCVSVYLYLSLYMDLFKPFHFSKPRPWYHC